MPVDGRAGHQSVKQANAGEQQANKAYASRPCNGEGSLRIVIVIMIDIKEIRRMDCVSHALFEGRRLRALPVADNDTREGPGAGTCG